MSKTKFIKVSTRHSLAFSINPDDILIDAANGDEDGSHDVYLCRRWVGYVQERSLKGDIKKLKRDLASSYENRLFNFGLHEAEISNGLELNEDEQKVVAKLLADCLKLAHDRTTHWLKHNPQNAYHFGTYPNGNLDLSAVIRSIQTHIARSRTPQKILEKL